MSGHAALWTAPLLAGGVLAAGAYVAAVLDAAVATLVAGTGLGGRILADPLRRAALLLLQRPSATERPDAAAWAVAPALYLAVAAAGVTIVPWSASFSIADVPAGIVLWGAAEALVVVAIFLHGWSPNAHQPLLAAYRFLAAGLSYLLLSMFVLIAAAIPARSLALGDIVGSQAGVWNALRQPLGLPLFLVVALGSASWGPMNLADAADLGGGTAADASGRPLLLWQVGRAAILSVFALLAATVFLGGWHGPLLPGPLWVAVKSMAVLVVLVVTGHRLARVPAERFVVLAWTVLLPLSAVDLAVAGVEALR